MRPLIERQRRGAGDGFVLPIPPEYKSEGSRAGEVDAIPVGWIYLFD